MTDYDLVADGYDEHFDRPVDSWEDERLESLLTPIVDGKFCLDLGCGTGWVLDHLCPLGYLGVDASAAMLERLAVKHVRETTVKATVGEPGWTKAIPAAWWPECDVVTATWSAHELGAIRRLLIELWPRLESGVVVALHGQAPRYRRRRHYVLPDDDRRAYLDFTPGVCRTAAIEGWRWLGATGTGALPDSMAVWRPVWRSALIAPARWHYAFLARWERL